MNGRCDIHVKGLHVSKGETVLPWSKSSLWKAPANVTQDCRNFCNHPMIGQQCGDASFGIDAQIFGRQLIALGNVHRYAFEIRPRLLQRDRSEEHTSELQSLMRSTYAVFCFQKKSNNKTL